MQFDSPQSIEIFETVKSIGDNRSSLEDMARQRQAVFLDFLIRFF